MVEALTKQFPVVEIFWEDFTASHGWAGRSELDLMIAGKPEDYMIRSVGYILDKDEDRIILVGTILDKNFSTDKGDIIADMVRVPVSQIREMIVMERPSEDSNS